MPEEVLVQLFTDSVEEMLGPFITILTLIIDIAAGLIIGISVILAFVSYLKVLKKDTKEQTMEKETIVLLVLPAFEDQIGVLVFNITDRTFRIIKKDIIKSRYKRVQDTVEALFKDQHLQEIETIPIAQIAQIAQRDIWISYEKCSDPYIKIEILTQIVNLLPYLTEYYKTMQKVVMKNKLSN